MPDCTNNNCVLRAAAKGAVIGLFASLSVRLADTLLGFLVWMTCAVFLGAIASVLYEFMFGKDESDECVNPEEQHFPLLVTTAQLRRSEKVLLEVPGVGKTEINLQPNWRDGGLLKISGLLPDGEVVVARLRVVDE